MLKSHLYCLTENGGKKNYVERSFNEFLHLITGAGLLTEFDQGLFDGSFAD